MDFSSFGFFLIQADLVWYSEAGLQQPNKITSVTLRKYMATVTQVMYQIFEVLGAQR